MRAWLLLVGRDLRLAWRQKGDLLLATAFFLLVGALFPFALGPEPNLLLRLGPGVVWVAALLSLLLSLERLFALEQEDGSLDLLLMGRLPAEALLLAKAAAHWITTGLPLVLAAPVVALLYALPPEGYSVLIASLLLGTPSLSLFGAAGAALCLGARRGSVLLPLLVLPLVVPVLIFGTAAVDAGLSGMAARPHLLLLAALLMIALPVAAFAGAAGLRQAAE